MIAIQVGIIIFLLLILAILYQEEHGKRRVARKAARLNRFWNGDKDRRKSTRINTEINVLYDLASGKAVSKRPSKSRNISAGGINLAMDEKLFPGTVLELQLNIPQSPRPIFTKGKIVWVKEISERFIKEKGKRFFATGIQFMQIKPADQSFLRSFINQRKREA